MPSTDALKPGTRFWAVDEDNSGETYGGRRCEPWVGQIWQEMRPGGLYTALVDFNGTAAELDAIRKRGDLSNYRRLTVNVGHMLFETFEVALRYWELSERACALAQLREATNVLDGLPERGRSLQQEHAQQCFRRSGTTSNIGTKTQRS